jgi:type II secretory pathway pseudopilin PulG
MIGVMAIMAILAAVIVPNVLKSVDAAALSAEDQSMTSLGVSVEGYLLKNRMLPTEENPAVTPPNIPSWAAELADLSSSGATDIAFNRRGQRRVYLIDPAPPRQRVIILSAMDNQLVASGINALPRQSDMTAARFEQIWATADGSIPPAGSWPNKWTPWYNRADAGRFLIIERVSLQSIYNNEIKNLKVTLNNQSTAAVNFRMAYSSSSSPTSWIPLPAGGSFVLETSSGYTLYPKDRLELSNLAAPSPATVPNYRHILRASDVTFTFKDGAWQLQP